MTREELKDILQSITAQLQETVAQPGQACLFRDAPSCDSCDSCDGCDVTTYYGVGEEG